MSSNPSNPLKEQEIAADAAGVHSARLKLEDLWRLADAGPKSARVMSFEEMNAAKARGAARSC
jgi:hypothetical protein